MSGEGPTPGAVADDVMEALDTDRVGLYELAWTARTLGIEAPEPSFLQRVVDELRVRRPDATVHWTRWPDGGDEQPFEGDLTALPDTAWLDPPAEGSYLALARDLGAVDAHTRRRAAGVLGFINGLMVATASTEYAREVAGMGALLADAELGDGEALQRAGGALARLRERMRTSRDEFHLLHADKAMQNHLNDRFEAALDELSLLLGAHAAGD